MEQELQPVFIESKLKQDWLVIVSRLVSSIFTPFLVPLLAFFLLFFCTYLRIIPFKYRVLVLTIVGSFTIIAPMMAIYLFQKINGWGIKGLSNREQRYVPYILTIISYVTCLITLYRMNLPRYMTGIIVASLLCMILCTIINFQWKISVHVASSGLMIGGLISYCFLFNFNPVRWLCVFILLSGMLGTARMILCRHTLLEVLIGFLVGLFCGVVGILFL